MADTFSTNLGLRLQQIGGNNNSWGGYNNTNFDTVDAKFGDLTSISTTGGTTVLTDTQEIVAAISVGGALVANAVIEFSGRGGFWIVKNATTGSYTVTCKVNGQTGVAIDQGNTALIWCDGTDIRLGNPPSAAVAETTVASAATTDVLGSASEFVAVSGTATITSLGTGTNRKRFVRATGAFVLTHNATSLILPGGADITAASGDTFIVVGDASSNARILAFQRASGAPLLLAGTIPGAATLSGAITFSSADTAFSSTECVSMPGGTGAQRPASPAVRDFRYNSTLGIFEYYDGTSWRSLTAPTPLPQGYLTLVSGTPVITTDQASKTAVYYAPDVGNLVPISTDGVVFVGREVSELTLTLVTNHLANAIYDVWLWDESGTVTIGTGPAWNTATAGAGARGTGAGTPELARLKGLLVNANSMTTRNGSTTYTVAANKGTYVGSILIDGTAGQVTCHRSFGQSRKWGVWNAYNRKPITLKAGDATASWTYSSSTVRASNNAAANSISVFCGLADEECTITARQRIDTVSGGTSAEANIGVGWNVTNAFSSFAGYVKSAAAVGPTAIVVDAATIGEYTAPPSLGLNTATMCESTPSAGGTVTFYGTEAKMLLTARWRG